MHVIKDEYELPPDIVWMKQRTLVQILWQRDQRTVRWRYG